MPTALFAIRFAAIGPSRAIGTDGIGVIVSGIDRAGRQIFIDDCFHECGGAHRANFEEADLLASQAHLRNGVVNDHAEFGMVANLKRINTHIRTERKAPRAQELKPGNEVRPQGMAAILRQ